MACRLIDAKPLTLEINCREICSEIDAFSFKKMHFKMLFAKWQQFSLGLNVLRNKHADSEVQ